VRCAPLGFITGTTVEKSYCQATHARQCYGLNLARITEREILNANIDHQGSTPTRLPSPDRTLHCHYLAPGQSPVLQFDSPISNVIGRIKLQKHRLAQAASSPAFRPRTS